MVLVKFTLVLVKEWRELVMELMVAVEGITAGVDNMMITILTQLHKYEKICSAIVKCCLR